MQDRPNNQRINAPLTRYLTSESIKNRGKVWLFGKLIVILHPNKCIKTMALEIKVIPTLTGEDAVRFVNNAESVSNGRERIDFSAQIADARAILKNARL